MPEDRQYIAGEDCGDGVPIIYEQTRLSDQTLIPIMEVLGSAELRLTIPSARPPVTGIEAEVSWWSAAGRPLAGAQVVALYPNKT